MTEPIASRWSCVVLDWHPELEGRTLGTLWAMGAVRFYCVTAAEEAARRAAADELGSRMLVMVGGDGAWPAFIFHVVRTSSCERALGTWLFPAEVQLRVYDLTLYWQRACAEVQVVRFNERYPEGSELYLDGLRLVSIDGRAFLNHVEEPVVWIRDQKIPVHLERLTYGETGPFGWSSTLRRALMEEE